MTWLPTVNNERVSVTLPADRATLPRSLFAVTSKKSTLPVGVPEVLLVRTLAVNVTDWFRVAGLADEARAVKLSVGAGRTVPPLWKLLPTAGIGFDVVFWTSWPLPFTLMMLLPGLAAVPRSTAPPVTAMAASVNPV